ncbi:hypothetical protein [Dietzia sp. ANT_WB102]|uniref:hypothetical protein n=1 Tax=Dietzia sp. ANT_WB102 TaxID=2597345 RepID=UPI0011F044D9|nr:hypothetical protein [Dietzia sp. ANT_WB102]KAA0918924.1 hypothetical protein FQ137_06365 [Dietzia sp. ANT_WB102]
MTTALFGRTSTIRLDDGTAAIEAILENTGARAVEVSGTLYLAEGPGGHSVPAVESGGKTIPPRIQWRADHRGAQ